MTLTQLPTEIIDRVREKLLSWGEGNIRNYPWRYQTDPYRILVSEFMLHRTQTAQVVPVYEKFVNTWPTLSDFAQGDPEEIETVLTPLGLRWRISGMIGAFKELWEKYQLVPLDYGRLVSIHGIGSYIAGATLCFSTDQKYPLVDTNTVRVVGRVLGLDITDKSRRKKIMIQSILEVCSPIHPRDFYYSMIDLAHLICHPDNPFCSDCPMLNTPCDYGVHFLNIK